MGKGGGKGKDKVIPPSLGGVKREETEEDKNKKAQQEKEAAKVKLPPGATGKLLPFPYFAAQDALAQAVAGTVYFIVVQISPPAMGLRPGGM